ncbi:MAG: PRC-barrel domain-containing protein, partial [Aggregatilineales bacterium]
MQFKDGTGVYSLDGQHIGRVARVVLNPKTKEVTDIVVRKGFLFTEDKTIPLGLIASATVDRVSLREDAGKLAELPPFEETHYIPLDEAEARKAAYPFGFASPLYWYPLMSPWMIGNSSGLGYAYPSRYRIEIEQNIPEGTVAL